MHQFTDKRIDVTITWRKPALIDDVRNLREENVKTLISIRYWDAIMKIISCFTLANALTNI